MMRSRFAASAAAVSATAVGLTLAMATPALAARPEGWGKETHVSAWEWVLVILAIPIALGAVITLLVMLPGLLKGEGFTGGQPVPAEGMSSERPAAH
ncbi:MAG: hypothetical protein QM572_17570 [Nocardioides sp.]|uniref:hypothetical protein n=1 Tax=Nocardioides sp. TaxID=35761 RepID=UPI0039E4B200